MAVSCWQLAIQLLVYRVEDLKIFFGFDIIPS